MHSDMNTIPSGKSSNPALAGLVILLCSATAGYAGWSLGERTREYAQVPLEISSKPYQFAELNAATMRVNSINGALVFGGLGLCLAIGAVVSVKLSGAGRGLPLLKIPASIIATTALGAAPSFLLMPLHASSSSQDPGSLDLTMPLLIHLGLFCPIGAGIGLTFGLLRAGSRKSVVDSIIAGIVGAALGTIAFEFAGAILLPTDKTNEALPGTAMARLMAMLCVSLGISLALIYLNFKNRRQLESLDNGDRSASIGVAAGD